MNPKFRTKIGCTWQQLPEQGHKHFNSICANAPISIPSSKYNCTYAGGRALRKGTVGRVDRNKELKQPFRRHETET